MPREGEPMEIRPDLAVVAAGRRLTRRTLLRWSADVPAGAATARISAALLCAAQNDVRRSGDRRTSRRRAAGQNRPLVSEEKDWGRQNDTTQ